jgi:hypothetical protein
MGFEVGLNFVCSVGGADLRPLPPFNRDTWGSENEQSGSAKQAKLRLSGC